MFRKLTSARSKHRAPKRPQARPRLEQLEKRELFIVGANFFPAVDPNFDGVVQVFGPTGSCSGTLLESGRHVLTAAHCVDYNATTRIGDGTIDPGSYSVRFQVGGRQIDIDGMTAADVRVPAAWTGNWRQNDIAILTLPELAPSGPGAEGADRSAIYRTSDEVGRAFTVVGYGATGTGTATFTTPAGHDWSFGTRRSGANQFDSASGTVLNLDLDNVAGEVITAPGDSGGPSFIGGRIAGVTSSGNLQSQFDAFGNRNYPGGSAIGATASYTRVSQFAGWIDGITGASYDLVLDMNSQVAGMDLTGDTIRVQRNGVNLEVLVNGKLYHSDLASRIRSVEIIGSAASDYIELFTEVPVEIDGGGGTNTLMAPNQFNAWTIDGANRGRIDDWATFSSIHNIKGNADVDIFSFQGAGRVSGTINGGGGTDVLNYQSYTTGVDVNLLERRATATGGVSNIENVKGGAGNDILVGNAGANTLHGYGGHDILDGGDGVDKLYGGVGRDVLIGGLGGDSLYGEGDEDLLIGGRLLTSATNIRREWMRTDVSYNTRVSNLRNGTGLTSGSRLVASNLPDDGATDTLDGGAGMDWYWGYTSEVRTREWDALHGRFELVN